MSVRVIEHSISPEGIEVATFLARYWRPIHSEVMTHRVFGRNARSSRAVPNKVLLREPIVEPLFYGMNRPGMQSLEEMTGWRKLLARATWLALARITRFGVRVLNFAGLHKQWSNRPLEWFGSIDVLITTTDFANWDMLRNHPAAAPEIRDLAIRMNRARVQSVPRLLKPGEWHLPFVNEGRAPHPGSRNAETAQCPYTRAQRSISALQTCGAAGAPLALCGRVRRDTRVCGSARNCMETCVGGSSYARRLRTRPCSTHD